ncbi:hypothetical protein [Streptomyces sp. AM 2-1-1]|uniref:hypothetical protein n=1 Tax=Streptomyces sp. AM 2-1-1 TaxID=3028709 RepID=UPI0023B9AD74|nr:hypothetical protein [Streptomyces sp. AM 2-1-1]WEH43965.1 hypothetical protein PZB77_30855 [Streptomyces sp. AM 2-1-1]
MTGRSRTRTAALRGTRTNPTPITPDTVPRGCFWFTDPDGTLCLAPSCMARIQDPDAECLCDTLTAHHRRARQQLRDLIRRDRYARTWWRALRAVVDEHPDRAALLAAARDRAHPSR